MSEKYVQDYQKTVNQALYLSEESAVFFADYKAKKLADWYSKKIPSDAKILDFGCGDGLMAHFVKHYFPEAHVYGIDPSPDNIQIAQEAYPHCTFSSLSDDQTIAFADNSFDLVYASEVFHHIPFLEHGHFIEELYRILKPGGRLIIMELNPLNPVTFIRFKRNPFEQDAKMLTPWYTHKLLSGFARTTTCFYCSFGQLYATSLQKA